MSGRYEQRAIAKYVDNLVTRTEALSLESGAISNWLEDEGQFLDIYFDEMASSGQNDRRPRKTSRKTWLVINDKLKARRLGLRSARLSIFDRNLHTICSRFELDRIEHGILDIICRYGQRCPLEDLIDGVLRSRCVDVFELLARMLGTSRANVTQRLTREAKLLGSGLVVIHIDQGSYRAFGLCLADGLLQSLTPPNLGFDDICSSLVGIPLRTELVWEDFEHISAERDFVFEILRGGTREAEPGINILLYGPPGTGKTEFAKLVAGKLGLNIYSVGETDGQGGEPSRNERLAKVQLSQKLLSNRENSILLFDEMEDLVGRNSMSEILGLSSGSSNNGSKVFINRLLENNLVPAFWTCNTISHFDPAFLRRMTMAVEIRTPTERVRERVWKRCLDRQGLSLPNYDIKHLAREFRSPPGLAMNAVNAAKLAGGGVDRIKLSVRSIAKAMNNGREQPFKKEADTSYKLSLLNPNIAIDCLTGSLRTSGSPLNFSLCLYGPPGTGKSAYARHLANCLGMEVLHKRASDLTSMWVGQTEKNIADAFAEARATEGFLVFDEADSFLQDRYGAQHSWEISRVNEMLTWMEVHAYPFACTTNLFESLDRASLRRFTFKVKFDYLLPGQIKAAFRHFFALDAPREVMDLSCLTPGDFSLVRQKAALMGLSENASALVGMLDQECQAKPGSGRAIGFRAA